MIQEYFRPANLRDALDLLNRDGLLTVPLAGGTVLSRGSDQDIALVDLQNLPLNSIQLQGNVWKIGATTKLQTMLDSNISAPFSLAIHREAFLNTRNQASLGGTLISADGKSILAAVLQAVDARLTWEPLGIDVSLGEWLLQKKFWPRNRLLIEVSFSSQVELRWEVIARSPADLPVVCVAAGIWPSGRVRVVAGGFGPVPILVMDGPEKSGVEAAIENALLSSDDEFASGAYRSQVGSVIANRLLS